MATLTVNEPTLTGAALAPVAAAASGDVFANDGKTLLYAKNVNAASRTVTVAAARACSFGTLSGHDAAMTLAQNEEKILGPFPQNRFSNSSGQCAVTYSSEVGVTVVPVRMPT